MVSLKDNHHKVSKTKFFLFFSLDTLTNVYEKNCKNWFCIIILLAYVSLFKGQQGQQLLLKWYYNALTLSIASREV